MKKEKRRLARKKPGKRKRESEISTKKSRNTRKDRGEKTGFFCFFIRKMAEGVRGGPVFGIRLVPGGARQKKFSARRKKYS